VLIVPTVAWPPAMPFTFQITGVLELFCTAAVNCFVRLTRTVALAGVRLMLTCGGATNNARTSGSEMRRTDTLPFKSIESRNARAAACRRLSHRIARPTRRETSRFWTDDYEVAVLSCAHFCPIAAIARRRSWGRIGFET
jgi:hypothetical protein